MRFFLALLFFVSCNQSETVIKKQNTDSLYVHGFFYPNESFVIKMNEEVIYKEKIDSMEYFEELINVKYDSTNKLECLLYYNGVKKIDTSFYIKKNNKKYRIIVPIGVPIDYKNQDSAKPPPFYKWYNMDPSLLRRVVKLDYIGSTKTF